MPESRRNVLLEALRGHEPVDALEAVHLTETLEFLGREPHPLSRTTTAGHITSSCFAIHPNQPDLVVLWHRKIGRWVQPGGHVEDSDPSVADAALRELCEETGASVADIATTLGVVDVDVHPIPAFQDQPEHLHFDVRYGFVMNAGWVPGEGARWMAASQVAAMQDPSTGRLGRKVLGFHGDKRP
ncbi:MAG: NUDIX hydrolase [Armatimonadota bacterium]